MSSENLNMDQVTEARRNAIADSIHSISIEEVNALGETLFPQIDHPWRQNFFDFTKENASETFHHAVTDDRIHIIYCHRKEKGMWFLLGSGKGPLGAKGLKILKEIVEANPSL